MAAARASSILLLSHCPLLWPNPKDTVPLLIPWGPVSIPGGMILPPAQLLPLGSDLTTIIHLLTSIRSTLHPQRPPTLSSCTWATLASGSQQVLHYPARPAFPCQQHILGSSKLLPWLCRFSVGCTSHRKAPSPSHLPLPNSC